MEIRTLMHKNTPVASYIFEDLKPKILFLTHNLEHIPIGANEKPDSICNWLLLRNIPANREHIDLLMDELKLSSSVQFAGITRNASLTDCYWFATQKDIWKGTKWEDINYHDNPITSNISEILFRGNRVEINNLETPDLSTNGHLAKYWTYTDKGWFLIKAQSELKQEVFGEIASYKLAQMAGINAVPYYYTEIDGAFCSVCPCLVSDSNTDLVSYSQLRSYGIPKRELKNFAMKHGFLNDFKNMLALDYLINNYDRNEWNISFLRDADNLHDIKMSPLFDHGESFGYDGFSDLVTPSTRSCLTGNYPKDDFMQNISPLCRNINVEEAKTMMSELSEELKISNTRSAKVIDVACKRIADYNMSLQREKENYER